MDNLDPQAFAAVAPAGPPLTTTAPGGTAAPASRHHSSSPSSTASSSHGLFNHPSTPSDSFVGTPASLHHQCYPSSSSPDASFQGSLDAYTGATAQSSSSSSSSSPFNAAPPPSNQFLTGPSYHRWGDSTGIGTGTGGATSNTPQLRTGFPSEPPSPDTQRALHGIASADPHRLSSLPPAASSSSADYLWPEVEDYLGTRGGLGVGADNSTYDSIFGRGQQQQQQHQHGGQYTVWTTQHAETPGGSSMSSTPSSSNLALPPLPQPGQYIAPEDPSLSPVLPFGAVAAAGPSSRTTGPVRHPRGRQGRQVSRSRSEEGDDGQGSDSVETQREKKKLYAKSFRDVERKYFEDLRRRLFPHDPHARRAECLEKAIASVDDLANARERERRRVEETEQLKLELERANRRVHGLEERVRQLEGFAQPYPMSRVNAQPW